jgi:hypothetical protein
LLALLLNPEDEGEISLWNLGWVSRITRHWFPEDLILMKVVCIIIRLNGYVPIHSHNPLHLSGLVEKQKDKSLANRCVWFYIYAGLTLCRPTRERIVGFRAKRSTFIEDRIVMASETSFLASRLNCLASLCHTLYIQCLVLWDPHILCVSWRSRQLLALLCWVRTASHGFPNSRFHIMSWSCHPRGPPPPKKGMLLPQMARRCCISCWWKVKHHLF